MSTVDSIFLDVSETPEQAAEWLSGLLGLEVVASDAEAIRLRGRAATVDGSSRTWPFLSLRTCPEPGHTISSPVRRQTQRTWTSGARGYGTERARRAADRMVMRAGPEPGPADETKTGSGAAGLV